MQMRVMYLSVMNTSEDQERNKQRKKPDSPVNRKTRARSMVLKACRDPRQKSKVKELSLG